MVVDEGSSSKFIRDRLNSHLPREAKTSITWNESSWWLSEQFADRRDNTDGYLFDDICSMIGDFVCFRSVLSPRGREMTKNNVQAILSYQIPGTVLYMIFNIH